MYSRNVTTFLFLQPGLNSDSVVFVSLSTVRVECGKNRICGHHDSGRDHDRSVSESGNRKMVSEIDLLKESGLASQTLFACHNGEVRKEKVQI